MEMIPKQINGFYPEGIDVNDAVLVDGQSILAMHAEWYEIPGSIWLKGPQIMKRRHLYERMASALFIQNLVVYKTVLVDKAVLTANERCQEISRLFPDIVSPLSVPDNYYRILHRILSSIIPGDMELPKNINATILAAAKKVLWSDLEKGLYDDLSRGNWSAQILSFGDTHNSLLRAHYYLELARQLGLFLSPHPNRSLYFKALGKTYLGMPQKILDFVDETLISSRASQFLSINLEVPAVAELVVNFAIKNRIDVVTAIYEVRNSKNAVSFRKWCRQLSELVRHGRQGFAAAQAVYKELERHCKAWRSNIGDFVHYRTRTLNLSKIPILGSILTTLGIEKLKYRDPILSGTKPYLLFLNDLYVEEGGPKLLMQIQEPSKSRTTRRKT